MKVTPNNNTLNAPFLEIIPDEKTRKRFSTHREKIDNACGTQGEREQRTRTLAKEMIQVAKNGSNEELLGALQALRDKFGRYFYFQDSFKDALVDRLGNHIEELDGRWSVLLTRLSGILPDEGVVTKEFTTKWKAWAQGLKDPKTFDQAVEPILQLEDTLPLEMVVKFAPVLTEPFLERVINHYVMSAVVGDLLNRKDLPPSLCRGAIQKELKAWGEIVPGANPEHHWAKYVWPDFLGEVVTRPHWQESNFADDFVAAFERVYSALATDRGRDYLKNNAVGVFAKWKGGRVSDWRKAYGLLKNDRKRLALLVRGSEFPLEIAKEILLDQQCDQLVKGGISRNKILRQDKEIREQLIKVGQSCAIWRKLLDSSTDPEEAGKLLSFIAGKDIRAARDAITARKFPKGTKIPSLVMSQLMSQSGKREERLSVIKSLPQISVTKDELPKLPARVMGRRTGA